MKRPAYQWYVGDADSDEIFRMMTFEQQGIYRALLDRQWESGSLPSELGSLARIIHCRLGSLRKHWPIIGQKFQPRADGRLINAKLDQQRQELEDFCRERSEAGHQGAISRWSRKKRHGSANGSAIAKPIATDSSSSSTSVQESKEHSLSGTRRPTPLQEFLEWYPRKYAERQNGARYVVVWSKHAPIIARLLKTIPPDDLRDDAEILMTTDEPWIEGTDRGIEILALKISLLEKMRAAWRAKQPKSTGH
jgi:uncharacterized protein YdaU (DUF1376 family)